MIPFIIGILSGYAFAGLLTVIGNATDLDVLKVIDFSVFDRLLVDGKIALGTFIAVPDFTFLTAFKGFGELNATYIGTIAVAYIPVAFVVFAEHLADHKNISSIIEKDLLEDPGLHRTLLGDGIGSLVGAVFGGCPNTTYGESVACVAITRNASIYTIIGAAVGAVIVSFLNPFIVFVNSIPSCVMGGVCLHGTVWIYRREWTENDSKGRSGRKQKSVCCFCHSHFGNRWTDHQLRQSYADSGCVRIDSWDSHKRNAWQKESRIKKRINIFKREPPQTCGGSLSLSA